MNELPSDPEAYAFTVSGGHSLLGVTPIAKRLGGIVVVSIEMYEDGVAVRWISAPPPASDHLPLEIRDDVGTSYRQASSGGFGNFAVVRGETLFVPAISEAAARIDLTLLGETISVERPSD